MWKRISAALFDWILLAILSVLFAWGIAGLVGFDGYYDSFVARYDAIAAEYDLDREAIADAAYSELSDETRAQVEAANAALAADSEALYAYGMVTQLMLIIVSFGVLGGHIALEFAVPLLLKDGRTIGKKIFGVGLMRTDGVKIGHVQLFIRAILGKYAVEVMLPIMVVMMFLLGTVNPIALIVVLALGFVQAAMLVSTRNHTPIHDLLAGTIAVDYFSQMIFSTRESMIAWKEAEQAKAAAQDDTLTGNE